MKHFISIAISLLLVTISVNTQGRSQRTIAAQGNLERAEQLADRFVQRFKETLDFETVYREFFIVEPNKRLLNSSSIVFDSKRYEEIKEKISPSETEQAYIGFMNLYYLVALYLSNVLTAEETSSETVKSKELFPAELLQAMKEPSTCFFFADYLEDTSCKDLPEFFQTVEDVRQFAKDANYLAVLFRKYMPLEPFNSPKYKAHLKQLDWNGAATNVNEGDSYFGVGEETKVYRVYRELFALDIVEENGEMKVLGIQIGD